MYYSLPFFPTELSHNVECIFITLLFNSKHRNYVDNDRLFEVIIKEFLILENEGLLIEVEGKMERVYFVFFLETI